MSEEAAYTLLEGVEAVSPFSAMELSSLEISAHEGPTGGYVGLFFVPGSEAELAESDELEEPINPTGKDSSS